MCNYLGYRVNQEKYIRLKGIEKAFGESAALHLLRSGFEYSDWEIILGSKDGSDIEIVKAHWEFIPWWIKNMEELKTARKQGIPWLNATAEKLLTSKMFRDAALKRRCLVPASCFYEWRHFTPEGTKKAISFPYMITVAQQPYFYMAGIYQPWTDRETGETMNTFAIITTAANSLMGQVHNTKKRMPTILTEDLASEWIRSDLSEIRIQQIAATQHLSGEMCARTIAKDFRISEDPTIAFEYTELPPLHP